MWESIMNFVSGVFEPAAKLIDDVNTSEEEKLKLKNALVDMQNEVTKKQIELVSKQMDLERELLNAQSSAIKSEATSESWITRSWRPITMLTFLVLIVLYSVGLIELQGEFAEQFMVLVQIGLGGYVVGRSAEKAIPSIAKSLAKRSSVG